ncbi:MAG: hypothetical protein P8M22_09795 [Phycisphaerales bacterium]|nr:hypothetical protein [Phycisphaerales bacterium]
MYRERDGIWYASNTAKIISLLAAWFWLTPLVQYVQLARRLAGRRA